MGGGGDHRNLTGGLFPLPKSGFSSPTWDRVLLILAPPEPAPPPPLAGVRGGDVTDEISASPHLTRDSLAEPGREGGALDKRFAVTISGGEGLPGERGLVGAEGGFVGESAELLEADAGRENHPPPGLSLSLEWGRCPDPLLRGLTVNSRASTPAERA